MCGEMPVLDVCRDTISQFWQIDIDVCEVVAIRSNTESSFTSPGGVDFA